MAGARNGVKDANRPDAGFELAETRMKRSAIVSAVTMQWLATRDDGTYEAITPMAAKWGAAV